jgi:hypothetical protein
MMPTPQLWMDSILSGRERVPAFEVIAVDEAWAVLLDDFVPAVGKIPRVLVFPREQDARAFIAKVKSGLSAAEAIEILLHKGGH